MSERLDEALFKRRAIANAAFILIVIPLSLLFIKFASSLTRETIAIAFDNKENANLSNALIAETFIAVFIFLAVAIFLTYKILAYIISALHELKGDWLRIGLRAWIITVYFNDGKSLELIFDACDDAQVQEKDKLLVTLENDTVLVIGNTEVGEMSIPCRNITRWTVKENGSWIRYYLESRHKNPKWYLRKSGDSYSGKKSDPRVDP